MSEKTSSLRLILHEIGIGLFLVCSTFVINLLHEIGAKIEDIRIHMSALNTEHSNTDRRITRLEDQVEDLQKRVTK